jgi:serine/threonine protein kinase
MYGRLEKYPTKFDPVLKQLIHKCLEKDEFKRLNAKEMLEYQNKIELEAFGEVRSAKLVKKILEVYN